MKALVLICFVLTLTGISQAQEYRKFKVSLGLGMPITSGNGLLTLEPAYLINDAISIGLRAESATIKRSYDIPVIGSLSVNGQYYFKAKRNLRPFVGLGVGTFKCTPSPDFGSSETKIGFYPRVGYDVTHFSISLDYNIIPSTQSPIAGELTNSYLGFRVGWYIGGGKKK